VVLGGRLQQIFFLMRVVLQKHGPQNNTTWFIDFLHTCVYKPGALIEAAYRDDRSHTSAIGGGRTSAAAEPAFPQMSETAPRCDCVFFLNLIPWSSK
jgi:hypothetical protein